MSYITKERKPAPCEILCFEVGDKVFAIESSVAGEISPTVATMKIPGAPDYIEGVFIKREKVITVINMHGLLDLPCPGDKRGMFVICHLENPDTEIGLHVSNVLSFTVGEKVSDSVIPTAYGEMPAYTVTADDMTVQVMDLKSVLNLAAV